MRQPDLIGRAGHAWETAAGPLEQYPANISAWLVNAPGYHPIWSWWRVDVVHLRDAPGLPAAVKHYHDAEYELDIAAINPESCPEPDPDKWEEGYPRLTPMDVCQQFDGMDDHQAHGIALRVIRLIVQGCLSPDQDFRRAWTSMLKTESQFFRARRNGRYATIPLCRVCGCTESRACPVYVPAFFQETGPGGIQGCSWVEPDLCSACHGEGRT